MKYTEITKLSSFVGRLVKDPDKSVVEATNLHLSMAGQPFDPAHDLRRPALQFPLKHLLSKLLNHV